MLQSVYTAPGLLNLRRHQLAGFLTLRQPQKVRQQIRQLLHRVVQIPGGEGESVGVYVVGVRRPGVDVKNGDLHAHHISGLRLQIYLLLGRHQRHVEGFLGHPGPGQNEVLVGLPDSRLHLLPERLVLPDQLQKLPHQLIPLILQQLIAAHGGDQLLLQSGQLHAGGIYMFCAHAVRSLSNLRCNTDPDTCP